MTRRQRPSKDLQKLGWQLRAALEQLEDDTDGPGARDFRRFLHAVVAHGWRASAEGKYQKVRKLVDLVLEARPYIDDALPKLAPRALAAIEVQQCLAFLYVGEEEMREVELENRLTDHGRNPTERAILEALACAERPLRQKEVYDRMPERARRTPARVGQILRELYGHGYTRRHLAPARGSSEASHYQLAPRGLALCRELGITESVAVAERRRVFAADSKTPPNLPKGIFHAWLEDEYHRSIVKGLVNNCSDYEKGREYLDKLHEVPPPQDPAKSDWDSNDPVRDLGCFELTQKVRETEGVHLYSGVRG